LAARVAVRAAARGGARRDAAAFVVVRALTIFFAM
jgi:hypothetical protein